MITRHKVKSSNLRSVGWDPTTGELEVEFVNGAVYRYSDVAEDVFNSVLAGTVDGSVGKTFNLRVRQGGYDYERVK